MEKINEEKNIRDLFAANLKRLREEAKMSQTDLAFAADLTPNYINDLEHSRKWPSANTIAQICLALNIIPYQLFLSESKWELSGAELFVEDLASSINVVVREQCDRHIMKKYQNNAEKKKF